MTDNSPGNHEASSPQQAAAVRLPVHLVIIAAVAIVTAAVYKVGHQDFARTMMLTAALLAMAITATQVVVMARADRAQRGSILLPLTMLSLSFMGFFAAGLVHESALGSTLWFVALAFAVASVVGVVLQSRRR